MISNSSGHQGGSPLLLESFSFNDCLSVTAMLDAVLLHQPWAKTQFSSVVFPPKERGTKCSRVMQANLLDFAAPGEQFGRVKASKGSPQ